MAKDLGDDPKEELDDLLRRDAEAQGEFERKKLALINRGRVTTPFDEAQDRLTELFDLESRRAGEKTAADRKAKKLIESIQKRQKKGFIVYGHDIGDAQHLRDLLRDRFHLEPHMLEPLAGMGRPMIDKFEEEAEGSSFACVLLTPDDQVSNSGNNYSQARANVLFELGWFYARLGRSRVVLLLKKGTRLPSDLEGVSRIEFNDSVEEKLIELEAELKGIGVI
jgi:predicted nucleotide-binding protein